MKGSNPEDIVYLWWCKCCPPTRCRWQAMTTQEWIVHVSDHIRILAAAPPDITVDK